MSPILLTSYWTGYLNTPLSLHQGKLNLEKNTEKSIVHILHPVFVLFCF